MTRSPYNIRESQFSKWVVGRIQGDVTEPEKSAKSKATAWTWVLPALLVLDFFLVFVWGWCLLRDQPILMAYLEIALACVALPLALLAILLRVRRPIVLEDLLRRFGTSQRCRYVIVGLSGLIFIITPLFWPLGWVGKCAPTSTPTLAPTPILTSTSTSTPAPTLTPYATLALTPELTLDYRDIQVSYLELVLVNSSSRQTIQRHPGQNGVTVVEPL